MRALGYTVDVILIGLTAYALYQHPAVTSVREDGVLGFLKSLPSAPVAAHGNTTGILLTLNSDYALVDPATAVVAQQWYDYVLGEDIGPRGRAAGESEYFVSANKWKNSLILPAIVRNSVPHMLACWLRNMIAGWALYFITGGLWGLWMYVIKSKQYYPDPSRKPSWHDIILQMQVSASAMVFYTLAPTIGEWMIERGLTYVYNDASIVGGWLYYALLLVAYMTFVEWGIYWMHRILHVKGLYELLHKPHHIYNNRDSLSPFAGLAFDPVDGLLQASPYLVGLLLLPVHFWTHEALLFFTGIWTTNIHDTLTGDTEPVMGSAYHTIHHTTYKNNYGQIFVLFDYIHDTLAPPPHRRQQWGWTTPTGRDYDVDYDALAKKSK